MKKIKLFIFSVSIIIILSACNNQSGFASYSESESLAPSSNSKIITDTPSLAVAREAYKLMLIDDGEESYYNLTIYNKNGNEVEHYKFGNEPRVQEISKEPLVYEIAGGIGAQWYFYYDYSEERVSQVYYNVVSRNKFTIAYMTFTDDYNQIRLIITDIFDISKSKEYIRQFSKVADPTHDIVEFKWIDNSEIEIEYLKGDNYDIVKEIIQY